ncbi:MAG: MFS family permease [Myxococcota bacterium]
MRRTFPGWLAGPIVGAACITMMAGAAQFAITATLGDVAVEFGVATAGDTQGATGMTAGTLGTGLAIIRLAGVLALVGSVFADRIGRRMVLLGGATLGLVLTGVASFMPTFWLFVAVVALGRPLLTTTNAVVPVVASEEAATKDRTSALAVMSAAYAFGAGAVSITRSLGDGVGYRALLLGTAALIFTLPLVAKLVRNSPASVQKAGVERPSFGLVDRAVARPLVVLSLLAVFTNLVTGPALTWLFLYGEQVLDASPGAMASLILLAGPAGLAGLLTGRWAGDRIGRRLTSALGTAAVPAAAVFAYSGSLGGLRVGYVTMVFALGLLGPPVAALLNEVMPTETRATANGWVGASAVIGGVLGLLVFGHLIDALSSYRAAAMWLFLPTAPLALGYLLLPDGVSPDVEEIDRLIAAEHE